MSAAPPPARALLLPESAARAVFWAGIYLFLFYLFLKAFEIRSGDLSLAIRRIDFIAFWAAGKLVLAGDGLAVFDLARLTAAADLPQEEVASFFWHYPPGFLLLVAPLGLMPLWAAWISFCLLSLACLALAARGFSAPLPGGWRLILASPVVLAGCLAIGQNSVLWSAGLIAALWAIRRELPLLAGFWIALLTLKPQLGILIPVALAAAGYWRVVGWATVLAVPVVGIPTLLFGIEYWQHFLADLDGTVRRMEEGYVLARLTSVYGLARGLGVDHSGAMLVQGLVTLALAAAVAWVWSRRAAAFDLKCAALAAAIPLATPYAYYYEMTLMVVAAMFLVRDGFGSSPLARLWLLVIWLGPIPALYLPSLTTTALGGTPVAIITAAICLARVWQRERCPAPS